MKSEPPPEVSDVMSDVISRAYEMGTIAGYAKGLKDAAEAVDGLDALQKIHGLMTGTLANMLKTH